MSGYRFPLDPGKYSIGRTDMGVDFGVQAGSPIRAIGDAIVDFVGQYRGFGPYVAYHLTEGPYKGTEIYDAEGQDILVKGGQRLKSGDVIGRASGASGGVEMGFAMHSGSYLPLAQPHYTEGQVTEEGQRFRSFLTNLGSQGQVGQMTPAERLEFIAEGAWRRGVDPGAVLADVQAEGGIVPAPPGDKGTSYGPFQLHVSGELPPGISNPQEWAWSAAGMNYALDRIRKVSYGLTGKEAINAIVSKFEQPSDIPAEQQKEWKTYQAAYASSALPPLPHPELAVNLGGVLPPTWKPWKRDFWLGGSANPFGGGGVFGGSDPITGALGGIGDFFGVVVWPFTHPLRAAEVIAGSVLVLIGLILLAKAMGVNINLPGGAGVPTVPGVPEIAAA